MAVWSLQNPKIEIDATSPRGKKQVLFWPISKNKKAKKKAIRKVDVLNLRFKNEVDVLNSRKKIEVDVLNLVDFGQISDLTIAETEISPRTTTAPRRHGYSVNRLLFILLFSVFSLLFSTSETRVRHLFW